MGTYASLSDEDKNIVGAWERNLRGWANDLARLLVAARVLQASYNASGGAQSIINTLDTGESIPNTSGIDGALSLINDTDWAALITGLNAFVSTYDTAATRQRIAQAAGPTAGLD